MHIKTSRGWRPIFIENVIPEKKTPTLLEMLSIPLDYDGVSEMQKYCDARRVYS